MPAVSDTRVAHALQRYGHVHTPLAVLKIEGTKVEALTIECSRPRGALQGISTEPYSVVSE